ncbi:MAG: hypothetical protein ACI9W6_000596, partial [Motiliproteus sp.]
RFVKERCFEALHSRKLLSSEERIIHPNSG